MIRYYGCWLDDGHLHIQTEYCDMGSMDCFVKNEKDLKSSVSNVVSSTINDNVSGIFMFTYVSLYVYVGIYMCMCRGSV